MGLGMCTFFYAFLRDMKYSITKSLLVLKVLDVCCSRTSNLHADISNWLLLLLIFSREVKMGVNQESSSRMETFLWLEIQTETIFWTKTCNPEPYHYPKFSPTCYSKFHFLWCVIHRSFFKHLCDH